MAEMEDRLNSILNDPQAMQKIMSMAQALGGTDPSAPSSPPPPSTAPDIDIATIARISDLARNSNIDPREKALLKALSAYLSKDRIGKLEKAMRAAKLAKLASAGIAQQNR